MFDHVFSPITIKGHTIKNRFTVPAMVCNFCNPDGTATERYIAYHETKAKGGWGLIITEDYNIAPEGHGFSCTAGLWNDGQIESHSELPRRVHKYGATILAQIYHCGRQTHSDRIPGYHTRSSSAMLCPFGDQIPIPFTTEEVKEVVGKYGDTALRAKKCGFDGVEIHGAHGYLINEFVSPYTNHREDAYGGSAENRARFPLNIIAKIREQEILDAIRDGADTVDGVKRRTRACMGLCQGKTCGRLVERIIAEKTGQSPADVLPQKSRMPARPVTVGMFRD